MYKISKIINNNFVCSVNEKGEEIILRGPGIGFQKKSNDLAEESKIEKIYSMSSKSMLNKLQSLVDNIPLEHIQVCTEIIEDIKLHLNKKLNDNIYITLTDHLSFAIERQRLKLEYKNALLWEIKKFYQTEYQAGLRALVIIKERLGVDLLEDEAGFIALHIVNAELDTNISDMMNITTLIQDILELTKSYYKIELDEESLHYERFITHLKYFGQRLFQNKTVKDDDFQLQKMIKTSYSKDYQCAEIINNYIKEKFHRELTGEEMMFLTIHLKRITME
ncbi:BglG family transcription antiterminator LicT [Anaerocolumna sp. MB42-C2]|uniref:BglG family transcription antiterminator LicT n=1 Tax=Anaerocolumna sp. MB42-C2 TaxID=3070997 RepID=UPI0027E0022A|nr:PRD domain-containing protein [Anaerocolumna sp. MB42-C2]WMJ86545.1 PRD domain-containing protein [Anaerocolumna sp. MB42-C2]